MTKARIRRMRIRYLRAVTLLRWVGLAVLLGFIPAGEGARAASGRRPGQAASQLLELFAPARTVRFVTRRLAEGTGATVVGFNSSSRFLFTCTTMRRSTAVGPGGRTLWNPSVQRVDLETGKVETILRGLDGCGTVALTPWGTLLAGESARDGGLYEILEPEGAREITVLDRAIGRVAPRFAAAVVLHDSVPRMPWGGALVVGPGVLFALDRRREGPETPGGYFFKLIPRSPATTTTIPSLRESPLRAGRLLALQGACRSIDPSTGACLVGDGRWIAVQPSRARRDAISGGSAGPRRCREPDLPERPDRSGRLMAPLCWTERGARTAGGSRAFCAFDSEPIDPNSPVGFHTVTTSRPEVSLNGLAFQPRWHNYLLAHDAPGGASSSFATVRTRTC